MRPATRDSITTDALRIEALLALGEKVDQLRELLLKIHVLPWNDPGLRPELELFVAESLDFLNTLDGDPDLEDGADDEPTMGAPEGLAGQSRYEWGRETLDEAEHDDGDRELGWANEGSQGCLTGSILDQEDGGDYEPNLAGHPSPFHALDAEEESEHDEPSLGSLDRQPQTLSYRLNTFNVDYEGDGDGREADLEPSLGWPTNSPRQMWDGPDYHSSQLLRMGGSDDREQDPSEEGEPEEYAP
jgi:hypothetical protein